MESMNENVLTKDTEPIASLLQSVRRSMKKADRLAESCRPPLNGERYMTDKEVSTRLHVSRRTLQEYRNNGILPYFILAGKVLYKEQDVQRLLENSYRRASG